MDHLSGDSWFGILGPLATVVAGRDVTPRAAHERSLLALLLTSPGRVFSVGEIVIALWGEVPPRQAERTVQVYVSRLRRSLGGSSLILTRAPGYRIAVDSASVDAARFEAAVAGARDAMRRKDLRRAAELLREGLELWRGEPLADIPAPFAEAERARLEEMRLTAIADRIDADLAFGAGAELVAELETLTTRYPLRERFWGQLMTALYRSGRQGEALAAHRRLRGLLVETLGVEPGPEVQVIASMVLAQDPRLSPAPPTDRELPAPLLAGGTIMVGRDGEIGWLRAGFDRADEEGRVIWLAVGGEHGSGRTRLLAELAGYAHQHGAIVTYANGGATSTAWPPPRERPALVVLEDLHEAPPAEFEPLAALAAQAPGRVLVVATYVPSRLSAPAERFLRRVGADRHLLAQLAGPCVADVVRRYVDESDVAEVVAACVGTGTLPGQVHRTAAAWAERRAVATLEGAAAQVADPRRALDSARDRVVDGVLHLQQVRDRRRAEAGAGTDDPVICPYKGLAFFDRADTEYFFGRERLVAELVARVVEVPLLAVVGPSGSGKSSIVRAGLVGALAAGALPGSDRWAYRITTPARGGWPEGGWFAGDGVSEDRSALIVVDQFEEAFTALTETDRTTLAARVVQAVRGGRRCVIAVRADYFGHLSAYPELARLLSSNVVLVGSMTAEELHAVIVRPAERAGLELDEGLADTLVAEVAAEPGGLPLLSTTLLGLWERRAGRRLTMRAHLEAGGVSGAIRRLGEAAYGRLKPDRQLIARRILLRLADTGSSGGYVRRRAPITELAPAGDAEARLVLDALADARLLSVGKEHAELAHEALLRQWPRLTTWLDEDEMGRRLLAHLAPAAAEWAARGKDAAELYRGARLSAALDWADGHDAVLSPVEREFLTAGRVLAEADAVRRRRSIRRLGVLVAVMAVLFALAAVTGGFAATQRSRADAAALAADVRSLRANAASSDSWDHALLLAAQAQRLDPSPQSRATLLATLQRSPEAIGIMNLKDRPWSLALSQDGTRLAIGDRIGNVQVFDTGTRRPLVTFAAMPSMPSVATVDFSPDGRRIAVVGATDPAEPPGNIAIADLAAGHPVPRILTAPSVSGAAFTADGTALVAAAYDGRVLVLNARTGEVVRTLGRTASPDARVQLSPDRAYVGIGSGEPDASAVIGVWELSRGRPVWTSRGAGIVSPGPGGKQAIVASIDGAVTAVDLATGTRRTADQVHTGPILAAVWRADGRAFVTTSDDRTAVVWNPAGLTVQARLHGHRGRVNGAAFAPDGATLYTTGLDRTVFVWDLDGGRRVARPVGPPPTVLFDDLRALSQDGRYAAGLDLIPGTRGLEVTDLVTGGRFSLTSADFARGFDLGIDDRGLRIAIMTSDPRGRTAVVRVLDVATRRLLPITVPVDTKGPDGRPHGTLALSPNGRTVTIVNGPGVIQRWNVDTQTRLSEVRPPLRGIKPWIRLDRSGDLSALVVGDIPSTIAVVNPRTGQILAQLQPSADYQLPAFSPNGELLAAGTMSGEILLWETRTWKLLHRWQAHDGPTATVTFTPDSRHIVSGGTDGKAGLWDVRTPTSGAAIVDVAHSGTTWVLVGTTTTGELVTVPNAGPPLRWDISPDHLLQHACDIVRRDLTTQEWTAVLPNRPYEHTCRR